VAAVVPSLSLAAVQETPTLLPPPDTVACGLPGAMNVCVAADADAEPVEDQKPNATLATTAAMTATTTPMEIRRLI
jgi:hypothetical protein